MTQDTLNSAYGCSHAIKNRCCQVSHCVVPEIFCTSTSAKCPHNLFPVLVWCFNPFLAIPAPVFMPEHPRDGVISLLISAIKDVLQFWNHWYFPWLPIAIFSFPGPQCYITIRKRYVVPCKAIDLVDSSGCCRVKNWRVCLDRSLFSPLTCPFVCKCHSIPIMPRFQFLPVEPGHAVLPHPALVQDIMFSPTEGHGFFPAD
jgi:hypothetical protein